jgi:Domain of unknown function DUF29
MATSTRTKTPAPPRTRHEDDLYTWTREQIALLRSRELNEIDTANITAELLNVGKDLIRRLHSSIAVLTMHLLKWDHQPEKRSRSWALTVREQRRRIDRLLHDNPSLRSKVAEVYEAGYADGRNRAIDETNVPDGTFPRVSPYAFDEIMTRVIELDVPEPSQKPRRRSPK